VSGLTVAPAARGAEIVFALSAAAEVQTEVLNLAGRPVAALSPVDGRAGLNRLAWSGLSAQGTAAPAGVYLIRVTARAPSGAESNALACVHLTP
jgi:flagellar hook assembly protein FlgD